MNELATYCTQAIMDNAGNELVLLRNACPGCGERRMDWLVWQEPDWDTVKCAACGHTYAPSGTEGVA